MRKSRRLSDIQLVLIALVVVLKTSEVENTFLKLIMIYKKAFTVSFFMLRPSATLQTPWRDLRQTVKDRGAE